MQDKKGFAVLLLTATWEDAAFSEVTTCIADSAASKSRKLKPCWRDRNKPLRRERQTSKIIIKLPTNYSV